MWFKRAVATLTIAIAVGAAAGTSFAATAPTPVGSLTFGTPGHAGVVYATGTSNGYDTTVSLVKNPGTRTQPGEATIRFEKWSQANHTLVAYYDFTLGLGYSGGRLAAGMTGNNFSFNGTDLNCAGGTGTYKITRASNSGSTITALAISFSESCTSPGSLTGSLQYGIK
jgi:hypothetical protein